mmetsp:Transcript_107629/g.197671  ORF Transcript_107629/g.197671 Transcript_107629/m.197671 type:complete len:90 (+) Transcript_107629:1306-1575(+)
MRRLPQCMKRTGVYMKPLSLLPVHVARRPSRQLRKPRSATFPSRATREITIASCEQRACLVERRLIELLQVPMSAHYNTSEEFVPPVQE